jgi:hypothetical protein
MEFPKGLGPLFFIIYINDLPPMIDTLSDSVLISRKNFEDFSAMSNTVLI